MVTNVTKMESATLILLVAWAEFSPVQSFQTSCEPDLSPIQWALVVLSQWVQQFMNKGNHLPPPTAEVKNEWNYTR